MIHPRFRSVVRIAVPAVLALGVGLSVAQSVDDELPAGPRLFAPNRYPSGERLLAEALDALPQVPLRIHAQVRTRPDGVKAAGETRLNVDMSLNWHPDAPSAHYVVRDAFGAPLESLRVSRSPDGRMDFLYYAGNPLIGAPPPDLYAPIQDTDISWIDLSMNFLWWKGAQTVGAEKIKGRFCYILDVPRPAADADGYTGVRLWIDPAIHVLLQAVIYGPDRQPIKRMEVKSFKKIEDLWMVKDIVVHAIPGRAKSTLRVGHVKIADRAATLDDDEEDDDYEDFLPEPEPVSPESPDLPLTETDSSG